MCVNIDVIDVNIDVIDVNIDVIDVYFNGLVHRETFQRLGLRPTERLVLFGTMGDQLRPFLETP